MDDPQHTEIFQDEIPERPYHNFGNNLGETYEACRKHIHESGVILRVSPMDKEGTESAVRRLQHEGFDIDWHWVSSRAVVKVAAFMEDEKREAARARFNEICLEFDRNLDAQISKLERQHLRSSASKAPLTV